ncbi:MULTISPECIES: nitronate monooxygenase [unclassified Mycolicibacterium]|uniref:nitronate monooxygenase n=1 Tax=unclassified Mycolicibacterium TaxID=2636767 RepID=UPI0012DD1264|nr:MULTISPECIES: nitronate monooxygenase [unclassified Mycolicibacterium]MUL82741.1 nitronate monooxygenase [Mycolicibacterium sp. CBMA 329]MUL89076.1 nitronate monooxygenase [Mycolicibacterium sp. CBMA 331]MUL97643.1 nitronate monooxygenase [Mycolicibacterium sp. CBMA 334]MUM28682.1 nitronate monooxygenase [Mycolicibacterium sp. CBMA 295]MUM38592.1 nitronate monooxygenase [Mycolicibacterium sp. CBMA 247]
MDIADRLQLDVPVLQAGMAGGIAGAPLAAAVSAAGGLGTLGLAPPRRLKSAIATVREQAPGRAVAVNLLMPFTRRPHIEVCLEAKIDVAVMAFEIDRALIRRLSEGGVFVMVMVGTEEQAATALAYGADGLIAQGREAGGHLVGTVAQADFLPKALALAGSRPVFAAGGIATAADTRVALAAGAAGVVAGTRFLLTHESGAHPAYRQRIIDADRTLETTVFGLAWPERHRVVPNAATNRWCHPDGRARRLPAAINKYSAPLSRVPDGGDGALLRLQHPALPFLTPFTLSADMPAEWVDRAALYAGDTALRLNRITTAAQAVAELTP